MGGRALTATWWWTVSRPGSVCSACSERCGLQLGAFDPRSKQIVCELCADRWRIVCKDSKRSRQWRRAAKG